MRGFASEYARFARSATPKSLKMLSGGISPPEAAWRELQKGRKVRPEQIALFVALDGEPSTALKSALKALAQHHKLNIRVVSVLGRNRLQVWPAV
jgi:adenylyl- and sulfurtransferase ThiI